MNDLSNGNVEVNGAERGVSAISAGADLLPLDLPERVIVLKVRESGAVRRHVFNPITRADTDAYFSAMVIATERAKGEALIHHIDSNTAGLELFERAVKRVEGYRLTDGRDLMDLPNWRDKIPGGHRIHAVNTLMRVTQSQGSVDLGIDPDGEVVYLDAVWSEGNGGMMQFRGLAHRFSSPTVKHWRKLNDRATRSTSIGGSRSQRTLYPKLNGVYLELYDALILSAEGYAVGGKPIGGREECISRMDAFHKIAAASVLFDKSSSAEQAEEFEDA